VAHLLSILFFVGLLAGLLALLETIVRDSGGAIVAALRGTAPARRMSGRGFALDDLGACLRASFAVGGRDGLGDDMARLLVQLSRAEAAPR
jgi:hypothetical protein